MSDRDQIYVQILHFGLISLHNHTSAGEIHYCAIEVEHLHEVPSLIGEMNETRHEYYLRTHRGNYLERVDHTKDSISFVLTRYRELWPQLEAIHAEAIAAL